MASTTSTTSQGARCCSVLELRQYTLYPGQRDVLIDLFDREFVETQEAVGMWIVGQFRDVDRPDRFVWIRGFSDMASRAQALAAFYGGPVWQAHRDAANATMIDSDDVLLLRPTGPEGAFLLPDGGRPTPGTGTQPAALVVATIYHLAAPAGSPETDAFARFFDDEVAPALSAANIHTLARLCTEPAENNFPALPVRTGENVFVWFTSYPSQQEYADRLDRLAGSAQWQRLESELETQFAAAPEQLRLVPTSRSLLR